MEMLRFQFYYFQLKNFQLVQFFEKVLRFSENLLQS